MSTQPPTSYTRHRFPIKIIRYAVWRSFRFPLSYREVAELRLEKENRRLKRLRAERVLEIDLLKELLGKNGNQAGQA